MDQINIKTAAPKGFVKLAVTEVTHFSEQRFAFKTERPDGPLAEFTSYALTPDTDRVMICGSMPMLETLKTCCENLGFAERSNSMPGQFVIEKAFAG